MRPPGVQFGLVLLLMAVMLTLLVTVLNHIPIPWTSGPAPVDRLATFYAEYAGGGSCEWREGFGVPRDPFPIVLRMALLAYPITLGAAVRFVRCLLAPPRGRSRLQAGLGLLLAGLMGVWLIRLDFVRAALEWC